MHTKRTAHHRVPLDPRPVVDLTGLHVLGRQCTACKTVTVVLDHADGRARCAVCGRTRVDKEPFDGDYCDRCQLIHWPNAVGDTPLAALRDVASYVSKRRTGGRFWKRSYYRRLPGMKPRPFTKTQLLLDAPLAQLTAEVDDLLASLAPPPADG